MSQFCSPSVVCVCVGGGGGGGERRSDRRKKSWLYIGSSQKLKHLFFLFCIKSIDLKKLLELFFSI